MTLLRLGRDRRRGTDNGTARRLALALTTLLGVLVVGSFGYWTLGLSPLDATYQAVTTVTTVGFREVEPFGRAEKVFTIVLVLAGVGVVLYTLTLALEALLEGHLRDAVGRRRMDRTIESFTGHAIVCGWGRVGRAASQQLSSAGMSVVVIDEDPERLDDCPFPFVVGDASSDEVLRSAGVLRAEVVVATLSTDAGSLYVTLSAKALNPGLKIIARARTDEADAKFMRAGADRVVNPQRIGGDRIAAFARQPHVVDFLDVAMHEAALEFRLEEVRVVEGSALAGTTVAATRAREGSAALLLALRSGSGEFVTNPPADTLITPGAVLIAVGTPAQMDDLRAAAR